MLTKDPITGAVPPTPNNLKEIGESLVRSLADIGFSYQTRETPWPTYVEFIRCLVDPRPELKAALYQVGSLPRLVSYPKLLEDRVAAHLTHSLHLPVKATPIQGFGVGFWVALDGNPQTFLGLPERAGGNDEMLIEVTRPKNLQSGLPGVLDYFDMLDELPQRLPPLTFCAGLSPDGPLMLKLTEINHLLAGGSTDSGKTSFFNQALLQLVNANGPDRLRLVLADLKRGMGFANYSLEKLPHLYDNVGEGGLVKTIDQLIAALEMLRDEMDTRSELMYGKANKLTRYNQLIREGRYPGPELPVILFVLDEINVAVIEESLKRPGKASQILPLFEALTAKSRSSGVYLWFGGQRIDPAYFTKMLLDNIDTKIALNIKSWPDLTEMLGQATKEELKVSGTPFGKGRGVVSSKTFRELTYIQVPLLDDDFWATSLALLGREAQDQGLHSTRPGYLASGLPGASDEGGVILEDQEPTNQVQVSTATKPRQTWLKKIERETRFGAVLVLYLIQQALQSPSRLFTNAEVKNWLWELPAELSNIRLAGLPGENKTAKLVAILEEASILVRSGSYATAPRALAVDILNIDQAEELLNRQIPTPAELLKARIQDQLV
jgi:hypothetical protein